MKSTILRAPMNHSVTRRGYVSATAAMRIGIIVVLVLTYFLFDFLYCTQISPRNAYLGFICRPSSLYFHVISLFFACVPCLFLPIRFQRPSDWTVTVLYLFSYLPTTFMVRHVLEMREAILLLFLMLSGIYVVHIVRLIKFDNIEASPRNSSNPRRINRGFVVLLGMLFVILTILYLWRVGFRFSIDFSTLYERRLAARGSTSRYWGYLLSIGRSVFPVYSIWLYYRTRRKMWLILLIISAAAIFTYDGTKSSLFVPAFLMFVLYLIAVLAGNKRWIIYTVPLLIIVGAMIGDYFVHHDIITEVFARRMFAVPGFLNAVYFDYFSRHAKALLTDSIIGLFLPPVYPVSVTFLIGNTFFYETTNANTGIWMGWFAHFGVVGVILVSILAGAILGFVDRLTLHGAPLLGALTATYLGLIWSEQMFHTSFLSGGVFYLLVALMLVLHRKTGALYSKRSTIG